VSTAAGPVRKSVVPLPAALITEAERSPWPRIARRCRVTLGRALPALAQQIDRMPLAVFGLDSGFFHLPAAQAREWGVPADTVEQLQELVGVGHVHFAFQDQVIDEGSAPAALCLVAGASQLAYLDGLGGFAGLAPASGARYRALHDRYYRSYVAAIGRDLAHRGHPRPYTPTEVIGLGDKAAPCATVLHLVADLAGRPDRGESAAQALMRLCTGLQLLDDLRDVAEDAACGNLTWPLTTALLAYPDIDTANAKHLWSAMVGSGAVRSCLAVADWSFADATCQAKACGATVLAELADVWRQRAADDHAALSSMTGSR